MSIQQVEDFREEARVLADVLESIGEDDWERETTFKQWTVNDVVQHLHFSDNMALLSATDVDAYVKLRDEVRAAREGGSSLLALTRSRIGHIRGRQLLEAWKAHWERLCDALAAKDPSERLTWSGPDMGLRMFATARQMETWAHGQEIYDLLGRTRSHGDRIRNIAEIGVRTYGWTFANRGLEQPGPPPFVRLTAPSGATWEWNAPNDSASVVASVAGTAVDFCQVVTQVRNIADVSLKVTGHAAERWMAIAQCFAGPPEDPPAPGSRVPPPSRV
jgi:uncharacterized protein (TIGR03084 family)